MVPCYNMFITLRPCVEVLAQKKKSTRILPSTCTFWISRSTCTIMHTWGWHKPAGVSVPDLVSKTYKNGLQLWIIDSPILVCIGILYKTRIVDMQLYYRNISYVMYKSTMHHMTHYHCVRMSVSETEKDPLQLASTDRHWPKWQSSGIKSPTFAANARAPHRLR